MHIAKSNRLFCCVREFWWGWCDDHDADDGGGWKWSAEQYKEQEFVVLFYCSVVTFT